MKNLIYLLIITFSLMACEEPFFIEEMKQTIEHNDSLRTYSMTINAKTEAGGYIYGVCFIVTERESGDTVYNDTSKYYKINLRLDTAKMYFVEMSKLGYDTVKLEMHYVWNHYTKYVIMPSTGEFYEFTFGAADNDTREPFKEFTYKIKEYGIDDWVQDGKVTDGFATVQLDYGIQYKIFIYKDRYETRYHWVYGPLEYTDKIYIGLSLKE